MFICEHEDLMCYDAKSNEFLLVEVIDKEHYVGEIGNFYYDSELFHIAMVDMADLPFSNMSFPASQERIDIREVLLYDGPVDQPVKEIPKGLLSCDLMFAGKVFKKGFKLEIDTSDVVSMAGMFGNSELPEGFTLGDKFDTSSVVVMTGMLYEAKLPRNFTFGSRFKIPPMVSAAEYCEDGYLGMLSGYKIYPDSDLSLFINSGCDLGMLFDNVEFSADYVFPDWFDFSSYPKKNRKC